MLDFTKNIVLEPSWQKYYGRLRALLYALAIAWGIVLTYTILFPSVPFKYSFNSDAFTKNTITDPRDENGLAIEKGKLAKDKKIVMDTALLGNFSTADVTLTLKKNSDISGSALVAHKSYRAFLYPTGDPVGFQDGNLLFSKGDFYIISNGEKRLFASQELTQAFGFTPDMFIMIDNDELNYNQSGADITDSTTYPDGTLFVINNTYYQLKNNTLFPFVSTGAFLSRYDARLALKKEVDFLDKFAISEEQIGMADGTLASIGISVSILRAGKNYPISSPQIFEELGYDWGAIYAANSEEVGIYKKQKILMQDAVHPDGTIFEDIQNKKYYIIQNGQKHPIIGTHLIEAYTRKIKPVIADSSSLENVATCTLKKDFLSWGKNTYTCTLSISKIANEKGNDYQFYSQFNSIATIDQININFHTAANWQNAKNALSRIKNSPLTFNVPK